MCLFPRLIKNKKYIANKKNGGNIPTVSDERVLYVPVGCGNCIECRKQKTREWRVRLAEELRSDNKAKFVTLTFSNEYLKELENELEEYAKGYVKDNRIAKLAMRRFLERWRKKYKKSVKHWMITELGENTDRIHMHGILWTEEDDEIIKKLWKYGHVWFGNYVNEKTINYIVKYMLKVDEKHKEYKSIILTSAGIGKGYMNRVDSERNKYNKDAETNETYKTRTGNKLALPIYYRNKIYTDEEREKLWLQKLDKEEIWVMGERIDISNGDEVYLKTLKYYQQKNKRMGYGDNTIDWEKKHYMEMKRKLKIKKDLKDIKEETKFTDVIKKTYKY